MFYYLFKYVDKKQLFRISKTVEEANLFEGITNSEYVLILFKRKRVERENEEICVVVRKSELSKLESECSRFIVVINHI